MSLNARKIAEFSSIVDFVRRSPIDLPSAIGIDFELRRAIRFFADNAISGRATENDEHVASRQEERDDRAVLGRALLRPFDNSNNNDIIKIFLIIIKIIINDIINC